MEELELPPMELIEKWVLKVINEFNLKKGDYTILPAYGGFLLFIKDQGLSWIPYDQIMDVEGEIDKNRLVETGAVLSGAATVLTLHFSPAILFIPSMLKGSYRTIAKPNPRRPMSFLKSMIDRVIVEEKKLNVNLLDRFEKRAIKTINEKGEEDQSIEIDIDKSVFGTNKEINEIPKTYTIMIIRKYFGEIDKGETNPILNFIFKLTTGSVKPEFAIPPEADALKFGEIIQKQGLRVVYKNIV